MKQKKKTNKIKEYLSTIPFILIGGVCGFLFPFFADEIGMENLTYAQRIMGLILELLAMYIVLFLQLVIHECGHLIFGLFTGYRFSAIRFGSLMFVKIDGRLKFKRLSIAGTGGQCLLSPPDMVDGKFPYVLYNLGGSILNLIVGLIFAVVAWFGRENGILFVIGVMFFVIGLGIGLMNGIPLRMGLVNNDGYNAISLGKSPDAARSFWVQLKVNEQLTRNVRLKNMPEEWFFMPNENELHNSMIATMAVFYVNYQMDLHHFSEVKENIDRLLKSDTAIVGLHKHLLICDQIYCELIKEANVEIIKQLLTKEQKSFMKQMRNYPSVIRTEYALALLLDQDAEKAEKMKMAFEKCAKKYPYPSDIEGEVELLKIAEQRGNAE